MQEKTTARAKSCFSPSSIHFLIGRHRSTHGNEKETGNMWQLLRFFFLLILFFPSRPARQNKARLPKTCSPGPGKRRLPSNGTLQHVRYAGTAQGPRHLPHPPLPLGGGFSSSPRHSVPRTNSPTHTQGWRSRPALLLLCSPAVILSRYC